MSYETFVEFRGNPARALDFVAETLVSIGFNLEERTGTTLIATGPSSTGKRFGQTAGELRERKDQSDLTFIDRIEVRVAASSLTAKVRFVRGGAIIPAIMLVAAVGSLMISVLGFLGVLHDRKGHAPPLIALIVPLAAGAILLAKVPAFYRYMANIGRESVDDLLSNAAAMARE